jgi:hypothetical protein
MTVVVSCCSKQCCWKSHEAQAVVATAKHMLHYTQASSACICQQQAQRERL